VLCEPALENESELLQVVHDRPLLGEIDTVTVPVSLLSVTETGTVMTSFL
jgi:hypothetical protein